VRTDVGFSATVPAVLRAGGRKCRAVADELFGPGQEQDLDGDDEVQHAKSLLSLVRDTGRS
jgi:hypothetical protein